MKKQSFETWLRNIFSSHKETLNLDEEWDLLLPHLEEKKKSRRFLFPFWWLGIATTFVLLGYGIYISIPTSENQYGSIDTAKHKISALSDNSIASPAVNPNDNASQNSELTSENEENLLVPYNTPNPKSATVQTSKQKNKISDVKFQFNYTSNKNQDLSSQTTTNPINNSTVVLIQNSPLSNNDMLPSLLITKKEEVIPLHTGSMETINSLMQTIAINHYPDDLPLVKMAEHKLDPIKKASKFLLAVEVYNGFLTQHFKGYGSQKTGRSETETALWRHSWKALAEYSFMPHWRVSTGMDYRWDLISFSQNFKDTSEVWMSGQIISEKTNSLGQTNRDTGTIQVKQYSQINRRLNNYRTGISIPIQLRYARSLYNSLDFSANIGVLIPVYTQGSGRIIKSGAHDIQLQDYADFTKKSPWTCNVSMGVEVVYHIRRRWDLNVGLQRQMEMSLSKTTENLVQETYSSWGLVSGIRMKF